MNNPSSPAVLDALRQVKQAIAAGRAEFVCLQEQARDLNSERDRLPRQSIPPHALRAEIGKHATAAIDAAAASLQQYIAGNVASFATQRTLNLPSAEKSQEGSPITFARFDKAQADAITKKDAPRLLPGVAAQPAPLDPLILAAVVLGQLEGKTPGDALADLLHALPDSALGYQRLGVYGLGTDRAAMQARMAEIDSELSTIAERMAELCEQLLALGVDTTQAGWQHEGAAQ